MSVPDFVWILIAIILMPFALLSLLILATLIAGGVHLFKFRRMIKRMHSLPEMEQVFCPECGSTRMIVFSSGGSSMVKCNRCGYTSVRMGEDSQL